MAHFRVLFLFLLSTRRIFGQTKSDCPQDVRLTCHLQETCGECMLVHPCCNWCYHETFSEQRCDFTEELKKKNCNKIEENQNSSVNASKPIKDFIDIKKASDANAAVQLKPQKFKVVLRPGQSVNLTFTYKAAKNYPLDLYYLGDLSHSMRSHLETLKNLGASLGNHLAMLTENYQVAFGSFLDKPGMPFILTDKEYFDNPCRNTDSLPCGKTYLFRHSLNFTTNTSVFFQKVKESEISANTDDLDGALEAIFQVLVCRHFGWSENSRKIIVLSTDSYLHQAGDGLLVGATKVNKNLCLMDFNGNHMDPLKYDYPSLSAIREMLREYKTNLIVAVTEDKRQPYDQMEEHLLKQESFVGTLSENSTNILDLVSKGYYDFIRQVEFSANTSSTSVPELQMQFFAQCDFLEGYEKASGCNNVEEGKPIHFKLQLSLDGAPMKVSDTLQIREKSINDFIDVEIEYVGGICKCTKNVKMTDLECGERGIKDCGRCHCDVGWKGETCSEQCDDNTSQCRHESNFHICSGNGECVCGKCICEQFYEGQYCQYKCPVVGTKTCAGNGQCTDGICYCNSGFTGDNCTCSTDTDECKIQMTDNTLCGGRGTCECNQCICNKGYSGKFCEWRNSTVNDMCGKLDSHVEQFLIKNINKVTQDNLTVIVENGQGSPDPGICDDCQYVTYVNGTQRCGVQYCYVKGDLQENYIHVTARRKCFYTVQAMGYGLAWAAFSAVVLGGLLIIIIRKCQIMSAEKKEFEAFKNTEQFSKSEENNPLYVSPISNYPNPIHESNASNNTRL